MVHVKKLGKLIEKRCCPGEWRAVKDAALHVDTVKDEVTILGEQVIYKEFMYLMMNKPQGVLSATEDKRDQTVIDLLDAEYRHF